MQNELAYSKGKAQSGGKGSSRLYSRDLTLFPNQARQLSKTQKYRQNKYNTVHQKIKKQGLTILILLSDGGPQLNSKCTWLCPKGEKAQLERKESSCERWSNLAQNKTDDRLKSKEVSLFQMTMCQWRFVPARKSPSLTPKAKWPGSCSRLMERKPRQRWPDTGTSSWLTRQIITETKDWVHDSEAKTPNVQSFE